MAYGSNCEDETGTATWCTANDICDTKRGREHPAEMRFLHVDALNNLTQPPS